MRRLPFLLLSAVTSVFLLGQQAALPSVAGRKAPGEKAAPVRFNRDVRPILANHCYACHGPDTGQRKAELRLDQKEGLFGELVSGNKALVPGNLEESELWQRIASPSPSKKMPPDKHGKPLSREQQETLRHWILQGAAWEGHWAYVPPVKPPLPTVRHKTWPRNGLDHFILARLERENLQPSPPADKATLLRRVTFDLTGLPPTLAELDSFLRDTSPNAFEKVVDRLLASPHYGERWALHWLDLARYADTNGYHIDNHRDMWKWREWVIEAFNKNKPFDQFTLEQLAGDLLPRPTLEQKIATGFHRNHPINFEGGADPAEYLSKYIGDRVTTTATVWLGTTLACAECHDHKYDPFTMKDYYALYAMFHNIPEEGLDGQKENPKPSLRVGSPEQYRQLDVIKQKLAEVNKQRQARLATLKLDELGACAEPQPEKPRDYVWIDDGVPPEAHSLGNEGAYSWKWVGPDAGPVFSGRAASKRSAHGLSQHLIEQAREPLRVGPGDKLFAHVWLDPQNPPEQIMLQWNDGTWEHRATWGADRIPWGQPGTGSRLAMGPLPPLGQWVRLEVPAGKVGLKPGALISGWAFTQFSGTVYWDRAGIVTGMPQGGDFTHQRDWERWEKVKPGPNVPPPVKDALKVSPAKRSKEQQRALAEHFVQFVQPRGKQLFAEFTQAAAEQQKAEAALLAQMPATMVMEEMGKPRETHILVRGDFQQKGAKVEPAVPASLPPLPPGAPANRLGLAKWLTQPNHPLTARVTVNRWWEQYFGTGLVKTGEDFGSQGEWPTHPELLDWLAVTFMESGWNIKATHKLMVMSATYQQSAKVTPTHLRTDPENRLYARGPRFRLPAEMIRDTALSLSGLLDQRIGGPSVRPYQPPGLWEALAFGGGFSSQTYEQSKGTDLYRRGLYVYWKRSLPHPSLATFDAPNREVCTDRRPRTNTPLQALVLLNDPIYVEAARVLGQRIHREGGPTLDSRLTFAFRLSTARTPTPQEMAVLTRIYQTQLRKYQQDKDAALKLVSVGESSRPPHMDVSELAAWTALSNVLLNLDETLTKG